MRNIAQEYIAHQHLLVHSALLKHKNKKFQNHTLAFWNIHTHIYRQLCILYEGAEYNKGIIGLRSRIYIGISRIRRKTRRRIILERDGKWLPLFPFILDYTICTACPIQQKLLFPRKSSTFIHKKFRRVCACATCVYSTTRCSKCIPSEFVFLFRLIDKIPSTHIYVYGCEIFCVHMFIDMIARHHLHAAYTNKRIYVFDALSIGIVIDKWIKI